METMIILGYEITVHKILEIMKQIYMKGKTVPYFEEKTNKCMN